MKKSKIALWVLMFAGCLQAADFTFSWDKAFPDSGDEILFKDGDGRTRVKISLFYTNITSSSSSPKKWCVEHMRVYPDEGGTITFTGKPMTFIMPKNQSRIYFYTNDCRLVFQNVVTNRITEIYHMEPAASRSCEWYGGKDFVTQEWEKVVDGANLDDWRPAVECKQTNPGDDSLTKGWENRGNTLNVFHFVRHGETATFQYHSDLVIYNGERYYKVVKMELKKGPDGIYARALTPTYKVIVQEGFESGFDVDAIEAGVNKKEKHLFVNTDGVMSGYGINRIAFIRESPVATVRYENNAHHYTTVRPHGNVRAEFSGGTRKRDGASAFQVTESLAEVAFSDTSSEWSVATGTSGSGRLVFERTIEGDSTVVLTNNKQNVMTSTGEYIIRGKSCGSGKMALDIASAEQLPRSNNTIRVEQNGILTLSYSGASDNKCRIVVSKGGIFRQKGNLPLKLGAQQIVADGGTLRFKHESSQDVYIYDNVILKNGAIMEASSGGRTYVQLHGTPGNKITVCGDSPSTNNAAISLMSPKNMVSTNVFHVLKTGDGAFAADLVQNGDIREYQGSAPYGKGHFYKSGNGSMLINAGFASTNEAIVAGGKLVFGAEASWTNTTDKGANVAAPIALEGTELEVVSGKIMKMGRLSRVEGNAKLTVGAGGAFEFQDSSDCATGWDAGATLEIEVADGGCVKFGSNSTALTDAQCAVLRLNGKAATLNNRGEVCGIGFFIIVR